MNHPNRSFAGALAAFAVILILAGGLKAVSSQVSGQQGSHTISLEDCTSVRLGTSIPISSIGEPVAGVTLAAPRWVAAAGNAPSYCSIDGAMSPTDTSPNGRPDQFPSRASGLVDESRRAAGWRRHERFYPESDCR